MAFREGETISAALNHVVYYPPQRSQIYPTILALHGRGTDELDLIPLVLSIGVKNALIISPRAPRPFDSGIGFAWYELSGEWLPSPETLSVSLNLLDRFITEIKNGYPVDPEQLILLGFSQGTVMVYATALQKPENFRGIAALSGYIPRKSGLPFDLKKLVGFPAFISHGTYDQIIPVQLGRHSAEFLEKAGAEVEYREYSMGHEVRQDTVGDLSNWMKRQLQ